MNISRLLPPIDSSDKTLYFNILRWSIVALLFIAMVNSYIDRGNISMVAPLITEEFLLNATDKGYIFSAFMVGYAIMQIPAGRIVDYFGVKWVYAIFYLFWGITAALFGFVETFWHFIVLRVLLGFCEAASGPASFAFIAKYFDKSERGFASGIFLAGTKVGPAIGAVLAGYLISAFGWRMLFILCGLIPLIWLIPWFMCNNRIEKYGKEYAAKEATQKTTSSAKGVLKKITLKMLLSKRETWGVFLGYFSYGYVWYLYINWLPSFLYDELGYSITETGWWSGFAYGGLAVITVLAGYVADYYIGRGQTESRIRKIFIVAGFLIGSIILLIPFIESQDYIISILIISISGMGLATANTWAITQSLAPEGTVGTLTAIQNFGATSGGTIAPALTGFLVTQTNSYDIPFILAGLLLIVGILSYTHIIGEVEPMEFENGDNDNSQHGILIDSESRLKVSQ